MLKLTKKEFDQLKNKNKVHSTKSSSIYKSDERKHAYQLAVSTLHDLQGIMCNSLSGSSFRVETYPETKSRADLSNLHKGVEDALQGIIYKNDRQIEEFGGKYIRDMNENIELNFI